MIYFWWNVWKEHNRRTFQQKSLQPRQVALLAKIISTVPVGNKTHGWWSDFLFA
jgi:hypothetical protein